MSGKDQITDLRKEMRRQNKQLKSSFPERKVGKVCWGNETFAVSWRNSTHFYVGPDGKYTTKFISAKKALDIEGSFQSTTKILYCSKLKKTSLHW